MVIFLDLDGVLVDFVRGASEVFNQDYDKIIEKWEPGCYDMEKMLGISKEKFFNTIEEKGEDFWAKLPPFPYSKDFYDHCTTLGKTVICTSPTYDCKSTSGKMRWLHKNYGRNFRNYILTPRKELCARSSHVLIDDHVPNVEKFRDNGGQAILFPAIHNSRHALAKNCVKVVKEELEMIRKKIDNI